LTPYFAPDVAVDCHAGLLSRASRISVFYNFDISDLQLFADTLCATLARIKSKYCSAGSTLPSDVHTAEEA